MYSSLISYTCNIELFHLLFTHVTLSCFFIFLLTSDSCPRSSSGSVAKKVFFSSFVPSPPHAPSPFFERSQIQAAVETMKNIPCNNKEKLLCSKYILTNVEFENLNSLLNNCIIFHSSVLH